jgi:hypothetical protein
VSRSLAHDADVFSRFVVACVAFMWLSWFAPTVATAATGDVIPPGNEPTVLRMLGSGETLPGGMTLERVSIAADAVHARYVGPTPLDVDLLLAAPHGEDLPSTERFALRCSPRNAAFEAALLTLIRKHEGSMRIIAPTKAPAPPGAHATAPAAATPGPRNYFLAVRVLRLTLAISWLALLAVGVVAATRARSIAREDLVAAGALFVIAVLLRAVQPWGPLDFAEGERIVSLWSRAAPPPRGDFATTAALFEGLVRLLPLGALLRFVGPLAGGLAVVAVYALARLAQQPPFWAALAGAVLALFPAHIHYSAGTAISVTTTMLWALTWCLAMRPTAGRGLAGVALLVVLPLAMFARPEGHLLAASLVPLALSSRWTHVHRIAVLIVLIALAGLHVALLPGSTAAPPSDLAQMWARQAAIDVVTSNPWWIAIAIIALLIAPFERAVRACALLAIAIPGAVYLRYASDNNSVWGQWRYFVVLLPWLCVGASAGAAMLSARVAERRRRQVIAVVAIACAAPLLWQVRWLRMPADSQREFQAVRDSAPAMLGAQRSPVLLRNMPSAEFHSVPAEGHLLIALASVLGRLDESADPCSASRAPTRVLDLEVMARDCPDALVRDDVRIYLGMYRPPQRLAALAAKGLRLDPISVVAHRTSPGLNAVNTSCPAEPGAPRPWAPDACAFETGWYRASRLVGAAP